jgi:hypothetical protein
MNTYTLTESKARVALRSTEAADASIFAKSVNAKTVSHNGHVAIEASFHNFTTGAMDNPTGIKRIASAIKAIEKNGGQVIDESGLRARYGI